MPKTGRGSAAVLLRETERVDEVSTDCVKQMERIAFALHEMCQPLMTLQCRLEISKMIATPEGYEEGVKESLSECDRLIQSVALLRQEVVRGLESARAS